MTRQDFPDWYTDGMPAPASTTDDDYLDINAHLLEILDSMGIVELDFRHARGLRIASEKGSYEWSIDETLDLDLSELEIPFFRERHEAKVPFTVVGRHGIDIATVRDRVNDSYDATAHKSIAVQYSENLTVEVMKITIDGDDAMASLKITGNGRYDA